jgi:tRNA dimethylallyltransferase
MTAKKYLLIIGGATASGKTDFAIALARHFHTEILSSDSRQFYREMSIGTAKPTPVELQSVPHHFINSLSIRDDYSAGDYERDALALLEKLYRDRDTVIVAGGSGLFIRALCEGLDNFPEIPPAIRDRVNHWYEKEGLQGLQKRLRESDPQYYTQVDTDNPRRLMRALVVQESTGRPYSLYLKNKSTERPFIPIYLALHRPRTELYERINLRVDKMVTEGLIEEARSLYPHRELNALQTVGYQELFEYFDGKLTSDEAVEAIKQHSRNYAKRQMTWFRNQGSWKQFNPGETDSCIAYIHWLIQENRNLSIEKIDDTHGLKAEILSFLKPEGSPESATLVQSKHQALIVLEATDPAAQKYLLHEALLRVEEKVIFLQQAGPNPVLEDISLQPVASQSLSPLLQAYLKKQTRPLFSVGRPGNSGLS